MVVDFPRAVLGTELAVAAGLHNVWLRKQGSGHVLLKTFVDGREVSTKDVDNFSKFEVTHVDTSAWAGKTVPVRFEITSAEAYSRHFGFAAEARTP